MVFNAAAEDSLREWRGVCFMFSGGRKEFIVGNVISRRG